MTGAAGQALSGVEGAIKAKGIDVEPVAGVVGKAGAAATEFASSSIAPAITDFGDFLSTASPTELAEVAFVAGGAYLLAPALLGAVGGVIRGYAGSIRPVEAYDEVLSGGNIVVVDVRSEQDAERGQPAFPRRAASKLVSVPREKLQGNFKNMGDVEATLTATKVASLKGVKRGTNVAGGQDHALIKQIVADLYDKGKGNGERKNLQDVYYNTGLAMYSVAFEGVRNAIKSGGRPLTPAKVKTGLESLRNFDANGLLAPVTVTAQDHGGGGKTRIEMWDGAKWVPQSDWISAYNDVVMEVVKKESAEFAKTNK